MSARTLEDCEKENRMLREKLTEFNTDKSAGQPPRPAQLVAEKGSIEELNNAIGRVLGVGYTASIETSPILKKNVTATLTCQNPAVTFECLHADGNNADCFIHSFLLVTCPNFRAAKVANKEYTEYATWYRTNTVVDIVKDVYAKNDFVPTNGGNSSMKQIEKNNILDDLVKPGRQLSDGLIKCMAYYYSINFILMGRAGVSGNRLARLIEGPPTNAENSVYMISNNSSKDGYGHFEPVRVQGDSRYILLPAEIQCILATYVGEGKHVIRSNVRRANMDYAKQQYVPKDYSWNPSGNITTAYRNGNKNILILEGYIDQLQAFNKAYFNQNKKMMSVAEEKKIEDLKDDIITAEIGVLNGQAIPLGLEKRVTDIVAPQSAVAPAPTSFLPSLSSLFSNPSSVAEQTKPVVTTQLQPGQWACPNCTLINNASATKCEVCDTPKPSTAVEAPSPSVYKRLSPTAVAARTQPEQSVDDVFKQIQGQTTAEDIATILAKNPSITYTILRPFVKDIRPLMVLTLNAFGILKAASMKGGSRRHRHRRRHRRTQKKRNTKVKRRRYRVVLK